MKKFLVVVLMIVVLGFAVPNALARQRYHRHRHGRTYWQNGAVSAVTVLVTGYDRPTVKIDEIADATFGQRRLQAQWPAGTP